MQREGLLLCLVGPAGGGKTTLGQRLLTEFPETRLSISVTTRAPRPGEVDGQSYYFISLPEFDARIAAGAFFEWEEIHGNRYGTLRSTLTEAIEQGRDLLLDIDIRGALRFKRDYPHHAVTVFLVPPSPAVLLERIRARGAMEPAELSRRLETARSEYRSLLERREARDGIDYFLVNDELEATYATLRGILLSERCRLGRLSRHDLGRVCTI